MVDDGASEAEEPSGHQQAASRDHGGVAADGDTSTSSTGKGHYGCERKASGDHGIRQASASDGAPASTSGQACAGIAEAPGSAPVGEHAPVADAGVGNAAADAGQAAGSADEDGRNAGRQATAGDQQASAAEAAGTADVAGDSAENQGAGGGEQAPSGGTAEAAGSTDEGISDAGSAGVAEARQAPAAGGASDSADEGGSEGDVCKQHAAPDGDVADTSTAETCKPSGAAEDAAEGAPQDAGAPPAGGRGPDADVKPGPIAVEAQAEVGPLAVTAQEAAAGAQSPTTLPEGAEPDTPVAVEGAVQQGAPEEPQVELKSGGAPLVAVLSCMWPHKVPEHQAR